MKTIELTKAERETLHLVMFFYRDRDIAEELEITEKTVSNRICRIAYKLGILDDRTAGKRLRERIREKINLEEIKYR